MPYNDRETTVTEYLNKLKKEISSTDENPNCQMTHEEQEELGIVLSEIKENTITEQLTPKVLWELNKRNKYSPNTIDFIAPLINDFNPDMRRAIFKNWEETIFKNLNKSLEKLRALDKEIRTLEKCYSWQTSVFNNEPPALVILSFMPILLVISMCFNMLMGNVDLDFNSTTAYSLMAAIVPSLLIEWKIMTMSKKKRLQHDFDDLKAKHFSQIDDYTKLLRVDNYQFKNQQKAHYEKWSKQLINDIGKGINTGTPVSNTAFQSVLDSAIKIITASQKEHQEKRLYRLPTLLGPSTLYDKSQLDLADNLCQLLKLDLPHIDDNPDLANKILDVHFADLKSSQSVHFLRRLLNETTQTNNNNINELQKSIEELALSPLHSLKESINTANEQIKEPFNLYSMFFASYEKNQLLNRLVFSVGATGFTLYIALIPTIAINPLYSLASFTTIYALSASYDQIKKKARLTKTIEKLEQDFNKEKDLLLTHFSTNSPLDNKDNEDSFSRPFFKEINHAVQNITAPPVQPNMKTPLLTNTQAKYEV
jgi:hypothetical protein